MIRALIADDEPHARAGIRALLARHEDVEIVGEAANGPDAVEAARRLAPDLLFLDIRMPGLDGFEVLAALERTPPVVVFTTAHDEFAVDAFEVAALDYLVKPFSNARFHAAVARARTALDTVPLAELGARLRGFMAHLPPELARSHGTQWLTRLSINTPGETLIVPVAGIDWIEAADYYARIHHDRQAHLYRMSLSALEEKLDPARFMRVHRSAIVALDRVVRVESSDDNQIVATLSTGARVPVARGRARPLRRRLAGESSV